MICFLAFDETDATWEEIGLIISVKPTIWFFWRLLRHHLINFWKFARIMLQSIIWQLLSYTFWVTFLLRGCSALQMFVERHVLQFEAIFKIRAAFFCYCVSLSVSSNYVLAAADTHFCLSLNVRWMELLLRSP